MKRNEYILWLPSWYPTEITPYDGDFIQRHARAVSAYHPLHIFHIIRDKKRKMTRSIRYVEKLQANLQETIVYYASPDIPIKIIDRFISQVRFWWIYRQYIRKLFREKGFPQLVHVHIIFKAGLIARWIDKKYGIPYVLTEQWTIHLPEARPNIFDISYTEQHLFSKIIDHARILLPVSDYLGRAMQKHWPNTLYEVIPNVVDHSLFYPEEKQPSAILSLVHISTLNYQKDPESLFKALSKIKNSGVAFRLDVFGPAAEPVISLIRENGVENEVTVHGEVPQEVLVKTLQQADGLILYSRYETFGCVIIEANACGIPVFVTDTALMHELVTEGVNGWLVKPDAPAALAASLIQFAGKRGSVNPQKIAAGTAKYSFEIVGKQIADVYERFTSDQPE